MAKPERPALGATATATGHIKAGAAARTVLATTRSNIAVPAQAAAAARHTSQ
jgi:hypothetical protein